MFQEALRSYEAGRFAQAEAALRQAVAANPRGFDARFLLGATLIRLRRDAESVAELERAVKLRPDHLDAAKLLAARYLAVDKPGAALPLLTPKLRAHAGDEELHLLALQAYHDRGDAGDRESALALARDVVARFPRSAGGRAFLGAELREAGRMPEARRELEQAIELDRGDLFARATLADVSLREGDVDEALRLARSVTIADPAHVAARVVAARALAQSGKNTEAVAEIDAALAAAPGRAVLHFELSRLHQRLGNTDLAARHASEYRRLRPN